ncbi:related to endoglucanase c [Cephalotrichum gorgonifer]|uniref:Related to endoglucanase c n=1 Tax=Cephalotrichum gorgonifer TaxID=2041049 RepID=A0AAE8SUC0_9PEZI|nr:related to endoglucanase c [Cephalotrichum gorgonifer]
MAHSLLLSALFAVPVVWAQECTLQFDGRVPADFAVADFDAANDLFNADNVLGEGLAFSDLIQLPAAGASIFDIDTVPLGVTISDDSIFNGQTGFRRAELIPASNSGTDDSTVGVKTLHFSISKDPLRPLNLEHEYQLVFLESNDFSTNQVVLKTGTVLGGATAGEDPDSLFLFGNVNEAAPGLLFSTPFTEGVVHNFGIVLDFDALTTQVLYSVDSDPLEAQTDAIDNDVSGQGQFHFGLLKKPIDTPAGGDITKEGTQEAGIDEGVVYGGIFQEDSSDGCISLSP